MTFDFRKGSRPIHIDKNNIKYSVDKYLVPKLKKAIAKLPYNKPIGVVPQSLAKISIYIDSVDNYEQVRCDIYVASKKAVNKKYPVLTGSAYPRKFKNGEAYVDIWIYLNGSISPEEYLYDGSNQDLSKGLAGFRQQYFSPISECTSHTCVPYGIYSILIHEITHVSEMAFAPKIQYEYDDNNQIKDQSKYINDPLEVRAFMQNIVEETITQASLIKNHRQGHQLVDMALKMSTTWTNIHEFLSPRNKQLILAAVYQAFVSEGLLEA